ncbi:regucalcin-like [Belonocnema kinseyi]|uniref:regucalcin-like n=1 Tax=Belonocnema kinseyi TaxID=2817044 RepID=UPI00143D503A|nr:regucalcin-like [Belonocnema kinseyi]
MSATYLSRNLGPAFTLQVWNAATEELRSDETTMLVMVVSTPAITVGNKTTNQPRKLIRNPTGNLTRNTLRNKAPLPTKTGYLSFAVPVHENPDLFVVGLNNKIIIIRWNSSENTFHPDSALLAIVDETIPSNILSYGTVDKLGRLMFGTMNFDGLKLANVSTLNFDLDLKTHISGFVWCKGIVVDPQASQVKVYLVNSETHNNLIAYKYHGKNGKIGNSKVVFDWSKQEMSGFPRRLTIDRDGKLWIALDGGHGIIQVDPNGKPKKIIQYVGLPALSVGACTFGGPNYDILFVSTMPIFHESHHGQHPQTDKGGSIFAIKGLHVQGWAPEEFRLNRFIIDSIFPETH